MNIHIIKRVLYLVLVFVLAIGLLAGCSSKSSTSSNNTTGNASSNSANNASSTSSTSEKTTGPEPLTLPIVKEPLKLTAFASVSSKVIDYVKSYDDVRAFQELEKRTGIDIQWQHPPAGQETEQFNLILASQQFPDMMFWTWRDIAGGPEKAIQDGAIIKLNDLIAKYAPNFSKLLEQYPIVRKQAMTDNGTFYSFPMIAGTILEGKLLPSQGPQIRKDWLDKLNLSVPTTIDQWHDVLTAFKQKDPNGNGKADELPFVSNKDSGLRNLAAAWGILYDFYVDNGQIKYGPIEPAFKDYVTTLKKWYDEGLIDPDYIATDSKNFSAKVTGNIGGSYIGAIGGNYGTFTTLMKDKDPNFKLVGAPWPIGPAGKSYTTESTLIQAVDSNGMAITTANKHLPESIKWIDYQYSDEGILLMCFGIEGESYVKNGDEIKYTDAIINNPEGRSVDMIIGKYAIGGTTGWCTLRPYLAAKLNRTVPGQDEVAQIWAQASRDLLVPPITPTQDESSKLASIMNEINTYRDETFNKFVMGQEPMENFDKFVQTIKSMGIDEALKIENAALERYNKR